MIPELAEWTPRATPGFAALEGACVRVEPMTDERWFTDLFEAFQADREGRIWDWLAYGPFAEEQAFLRWARSTYLSNPLIFHAIIPRASGRAEGVAALMRIDEANGVCEIGHVCLAPSLQGTRAATEAFFLLMSRVFDELGYRRLEWKCNNDNAKSKRAAERLGFTYEGLFRQHMVVKNRNRDTAWFAIVDGEWPAIRRRFEAWLDPSNFTSEGRQVKALHDLA